SGFIYPIFGHWCWGPDGFLATMGSPNGFLSYLGMNFHDFAGSTVVHSIGGWVAIAGAIMLGPRLGRKFKRDGGGPMPPHDLTIAVIGGLIPGVRRGRLQPRPPPSPHDHARRRPPPPHTPPAPP